MPQPRRAPVILVPGLLVALALLVLTSSSHASSRLAVMDLRPQEGVTAAEARTLTGLLRTALHQTEAFALINREDLEEIARNYQIELTVCDDDACLLRLGTLVGAQLLVTGDVGKVFEEFVVNLRLVDLAGETLANRVITSEVTRGDARSFQASMTRAARTLAGLSGPEGETPGLPAREPATGAARDSAGEAARLSAPATGQDRTQKFSARAGISPFTGWLGLGYRNRHLGIDAGFVYIEGPGVAAGARYYLGASGAAWFIGFGGFCEWHERPAGYQDRSLRAGLLVGRLWPLGRSWDLIVGAGFARYEHVDRMPGLMGSPEAETEIEHGAMPFGEISIGRRL